MRHCLGVSLAGLLSLGTTVAPAVAADDPGCKDHPLFTRMPGFSIDGCESQEFAREAFYDAQDREIGVEGKLSSVTYALQSGARTPSELQIVRNFTSAAQRIGGQVLSEAGAQAYMRVVQAGREAWVRVRAYNQGEMYELTIVERQAMVQEITANQMLEELNAKGFVALYINFDTNKATIKPESQPIVEQVAALLRGQATLRLSVEGHTDNTGTPHGNQALSRQRAEAVVAALVQKGIAGARLGALGWGQDRPIADNRSEEGRAKNRRVEIVKK